MEGGYDYDYEKQREFAFCIIDNKLYKNDQHFECLLDYLQEQGYDKDSIFEYDDKKLESMVGDKTIFGEVGIINKCKGIIINSIDHVNTIRQFYNLPIYINDYGVIEEYVS